MWNKLKKINDLSLMVKALCFLVFLVAVIAVKNIYIIVAMTLFLLLLTVIIKDKIVIVNTIITISLLVGNFFLTDVLIYLKISLVLNHLLSMIVLTPKDDLLAIYYNVFYRPRDFKEVKTYLQELYYKDKYRKNMQNLKQVAEEMGLDKKTDYYRNLSEKVTKKTNRDIYELIEVNYLRFFNVPKKRIKLEKKPWLELDNTFLIIHILLLAIAIIYRR